MRLLVHRVLEAVVAFFSGYNLASAKKPCFLHNAANKGNCGHIGAPITQPDYAVFANILYFIGNNELARSKLRGINRKKLSIYLPAVKNLIERRSKLRGLKSDTWPTSGHGTQPDLKVIEKEIVIQVRFLGA